MKIELVVQNNKTGIIYDVSELASDISWETEITEQPGKLTFNFVSDGKANFNEGSPVYLKVDGQGIFYGWVFTKKYSKDEIIQVTAYDQIRYLKNVDTYVLPSMTSSEIFIKICKDFQLKYKVVEGSEYKLPPSVNDAKTLGSIIQSALDATLSSFGKWFIVYDEFGTLVHRDIVNLKTNLVFGDESGLIDYDYQTSIDDSYNQIKLVRDNKDTKKREVYLVKDSNNIQLWGLLQYYEKVDENMNAAQIMAKADNLLKLHNSVTRPLSLECLGNFKVRAGSGIYLSIKKLGDVAVNQYAMVKKCTHKIKNNLHTMNLKVELVI